MKSRENFIAAQEALFRRVGLRAESRFLDMPALDGPAHVLVAGEGPPVLLIAGLGDPAAMWAPLMSKLKGFTLYAVDRPCFGLSGSAEHKTDTLRSLAVGFLEQVLDALELERAQFVSNSMGSLWTLWLALDRPQRVTAMTHVGCPALILGTSAPIPMRLISFPPLGRLLMALTPPSPKQVDQFAAMAGEDLSSLPEMRDLLVQMQKLPGARKSVRQLLHSVLRFRGARPQIALNEDQLSRVTQPSLVIWGDRDPFGSVEVGKKLAQLTQRTEFHQIAEAGHVPWVIRPDEVSRIATPFLQAHA